MVANPSAFDPIAHPQAARGRRDLVLEDMLRQRVVTRAEYNTAINAPLPTAADIEQPNEPTAAPYFTSWLRPQIISAIEKTAHVSASVAEYRAYYGGLTIKTTIDLRLQQAAEEAVAQNLPYTKDGPVATLVAIDNKTGEVRAMVGGPVMSNSEGGVSEDYDQFPFNLATEGHRQPGSSFKPFTLAVALDLRRSAGLRLHLGAEQLRRAEQRRQGDTSSSATSATRTPGRSHSRTQRRTPTTLSTPGSDPGTRDDRHDPRLAPRDDDGDPHPRLPQLRDDPRGLKVGVSALDMAHAYETFATGGQQVFNPVLGAPHQGPTGIAQVECSLAKRATASTEVVDVPTYKRILPAVIAQAVHDILDAVVQFGTGTAAAIPGVDVAGKTGTTSELR